MSKDRRKEKRLEHGNTVYVVRDDGAVMIDGDRNGTWSFGEPGADGSLMFNGEKVDELVAMAFVPGRDTGCLVEHRDGDRRNNRADNLRYIGRLESFLLKGNLLRRLELETGHDAESIIRKIRLIREAREREDARWLCEVTQEEIARTISRLKDTGGKGCYRLGIRPSLTPNALQKGLSEAYSFPLCPKLHSSSLADYRGTLRTGRAVMVEQTDRNCVVDAELSEDGDRLCIRTRSARLYRPHGLLVVTIEYGQFLHDGRFFHDKESRDREFMKELEARDSP